ncbi:tyrosine-type recombinase/integrase [Ferruginibacter sp.]
MSAKQYPLIPLFEKFIRQTHSGRRLKADGSRIKKQTVGNYDYVLQYLKDYEQKFSTSLVIKPVTGNNKRSQKAEAAYWKKFYHQFTDFLYRDKDCYDNYVGAVIKIIRMFFNYVNKELLIRTGDFYKKFYICKEEIPVITFLPEQLQFLINDQHFHEQLPRTLQKAKDIMVFGCTVALRVSDLFAIKFTDIEKTGEQYYLQVKTIKTDTEVRIKLPVYAVAIVEKFRLAAKKRKTIFPPIPRTRFNNQMKQIAERAGWTKEVGKQRKKRGIDAKPLLNAANKQYRFCDLVSSHTMRKTAITTMLMLGMKEHVVKKISGHSADSKSFYRYVNLVQSYLDNEMDQVFNRLIEVA